MRHPTHQSGLLTCCAAGLLACAGSRDGAAADTAGAATTAPASGAATVTDAQRRAREDSANAFLKRSVDLVLRPDSTRAMARYAGAGPIVFVNQGELVTSRDQQARVVGEVARGRPEATAIKLDFTKVDVLAPDAAAVTTTMTGTATDPKTGKPITIRAAYTAVLRLEDGQTRAVQQHQSFPMPEAK